MHTILHHMTVHVWGWVAGVASLGVLAAYFAPPFAPGFFMFTGILLMMKNEGTSLEHIIEDDVPVVDDLVGKGQDLPIQTA
jgi:hypothetical protein